MSNLNLNINEYQLSDIEKLFRIKNNEHLNEEQLDNKLTNLLVSVRTQIKDNEEYEKIRNFLIVAKEKYKILSNYATIKYDNIYPITEKLKPDLIDNKFLDKNEHMVIEQQKESLEYKMVSINSALRDTSKWPNASEFEIELPESIKDIESMQLYSWNMNYYINNISTWYQNTKFTLIMNSINGGANPLVGVDTIISIPEGYYTYGDFYNIITNTMNKTIENIIGASYNSFNIILDQVTNQAVIYNLKLASNISDGFQLIFSKSEEYSKNKYQPINMYNLNYYWGLGYYLGFDKEDYTSTLQNLNINYNNGIQEIGMCNYIISPNISTPYLDNIIHLEIDGFNNIDKINKVNSFMAKLPIGVGTQNDTGGFETSVVKYERLSKLKIRLCFYNNVTLYMSKNQNWDFTLQFVCKK
jgi:hypothetical protein